jgi:hypothetical protein
VDIVGESFNIKSIRKIVRKKPGEHYMRATLVREPKNKHDSNAVRVDIAGRTVGHIPKEEAPSYHALLEAAQQAGVSVEAECRVWYDNEYDERGSVRLDMIDPAFAWPVNPVGASAAVGVWPEGRKLKISSGPEHSEGLEQLLSSAYEPGGCSAYVRLGLPEDGGNKMITYFNGEPIGLLSPAATTKMRPAIELADANDQEIYALIEVKGNRLAADIKILMTPTAELSEDEIRNLTG